MDNELKVTVICLTYNHVKYIRHAIESFIMQKTDFKYEIIIHDDASTDGTADIVREYGQKYPNIIKIICQKENMYSKGVRGAIYTNYVCKIINGKYTALCEGDDYWCDPMKLQRQVDILEANPDCHLCVHRVNNVSEDEKLLDMMTPYRHIQDGIMKTEEYIELAARRFAFQASSYCCISKDIINYYNDLPEFSKVCDIGDVPYLLYFASQGKVYYLDQAMSCYRRNSIGSWSSRKKSSTDEKRIIHQKKMKRMIEEFDKYTNYKYHDICDSIALNHYFMSLLYSYDFKITSREAPNCIDPQTDIDNPNMDESTKTNCLGFAYVERNYNVSYDNDKLTIKDMTSEKEAYYKLDNIVRMSILPSLI